MILGLTRILVLDNIMNHGGAQAMMMNYYRAIDRNKIQFDFLLHRKEKGAYDNEIYKLGGRIYRIIPPYPQNYFKYRRLFGKILEENNFYKIIHSNMTETGLFAFMEAKSRGIPIRICHAHTTKTTTLLKEIVLSLYSKEIDKYTTHKFACGIEAAKYAYGSTDDVIYMHNAIDTTKFKYNVNVRRKVRKAFNINDRFVIGHIGRFFEAKNHKFLINVFNHIHQRIPNSVLMLVGGGEMDKDSINGIKKKVDSMNLTSSVIFTGIRDDINELIQGFDLFCLPSLWEGLPVVMVEAQTSGVKCVISDKVSKECILTPNVDVLPLHKGAEFWGDYIVDNCIKYDRKDYSKIIKEKKYDIYENAKWLENLYSSFIERV